MTPSTTIVDALLNSICVKSEDRHVPYRFGEVVMATEGSHALVIPASLTSISEFPELKSNLLDSILLRFKPWDSCAQIIEIADLENCLEGIQKETIHDPCSECLGKGVVFFEDDFFDEDNDESVLAPTVCLSCNGNKIDPEHFREQYSGKDIVALNNIPFRPGDMEVLLMAAKVFSATEIVNLSRNRNGINAFELITEHSLDYSIRFYCLAMGPLEEFEKHELPHFIEPSCEIPARSMQDWLLHGDRGRSSLTLLNGILRQEVEYPLFKSSDTTVPLDHSDYIRCLTLVNQCQIPKEKLLNVKEFYPIWTPFIDNWDALEKRYNEELLTLDFKCLMEDVKILHDQSLKYATKKV